MDTSLFLARIIGPLFLVVGAGVMLNAKHYATMAHHFLKNSELYYFSGAISLVVGLAIVLNHNLWTPDWRVVITILGWMSILKGVLRILLPKTGAEASERFLNSTWEVKLSSIPILILGAWLTYEGFLA